jgi:hypothetical protein
VDAAWIALLGGAVGAAGATGAAALTGWSARRQAAIQQSGQRQQWQHEKRREAYSALLDAGAQARDEHAAIRRALMLSNPDLDAARQGLDLAVPLVRAVRRASAAVFIDGPDIILEPTRRAEEHIVLLHRLLSSVVVDLTYGGVPSEQLRLCARQEACVRSLMDEFAAAARQVFTGLQQTSKLLPVGIAVPFDAELAWLIEYLSSELSCDSAMIDPARPMMELSLDSLQLLKLTSSAARHFGVDNGHIWPVSSLLFDTTVEGTASYIASLRRDA